MLKHFIKTPKSTGAILASSKALSKRMVANLDFDNAKTIVELGPGSGAITNQILTKINDKQKFFAIELNEELYKELSQKMPDLKLYNDNASNLAQILEKENCVSVDIVISGLPWVLFSKELQEEILNSILNSLSNNGSFVTFSYVHGKIFPSAKRFIHLLHQKFDIVEKSKIVWKNIPPAIVYKCTKK